MVLNLYALLYFYDKNLTHVKFILRKILSSRLSRFYLLVKNFLNHYPYTVLVRLFDFHPQNTKHHVVLLYFDVLMILNMIFL